MQPYAPRPLTFAGIEQHTDWRIKHYRIRYGDAEFGAERFDSGIARALADLPVPAVTPSRPGVGFLIAHQGRSVDYLILAWWDRENELPMRIWVHEHSAGSAWRPAVGSESVCVWDLQVIWHEREAYVATVLGNAETGARTVEDYLARIAAG